MDFRERMRGYSERLDAEIRDKSFKSDLAARFIVIWTLLTRIPLPKAWWPEPAPAGNRALALAPLAGGLMGLLTGLVVSAAAAFDLNAVACAWIGAAFYFVIGWALHLDGWSDLWDGIGSGRSGEELRAVMKDSRLGSYGGASLIIAFGLWTALLASTAPEYRLSACVTAGAASRFAEDVAAYFGEYPWESGMGKGWVDGFTAYDLFISSLTLVVFLPVSIFHFSLCVALSALTAFFIARMMNAKLGGVNGDVMGAAAVAAELISLAVWAI
ncbi:MAG: adenosylcobinamide-GDP ribazoletransferase [Synergistaceae bacterium]|nr:adenosylcobinamide-GDP ribazoletransferase [Synergistaceae bacterium]